MNAIEVFNAVANKKVDSGVLGVLRSESKSEVYSITDKQYNWLVSTVCKYYKWDGLCAISFTDKKFTYTIDPKQKFYNVPYYIPNNKTYGTTHFIIKTPLT